MLGRRCCRRGCPRVYDPLPMKALKSVLAAAAGVLAMHLGACAATQAPGTAASAESDSAIAARVMHALESDPYFYEEHCRATIEHGAVVLTGEVQDNRAMFDALDAAQRAAPGRKIINHLSIEKTSAH